MGRAGGGFPVAVRRHRTLHRRDRGLSGSPIRASRYCQGVQPVATRGVGTVSRLCAYPFDTMQRRLQIEASKPAEEKMYTGMADCFKKILQKEGPKGFFKGAFANILRGTGAAIVLVLYDEIMNFVNRFS